MRALERMEWPQKHKIKGSVLLIALIAVGFGIWMQKRQNQNLVNHVEISELSFNDWGSQYIELGYTIENKTDSTLNLYLLAIIYDQDDVELASTLFAITLPPHVRQTRSKLLDSLNRSLHAGERPHRATLSIYPKRKF